MKFLKTFESHEVEMSRQEMCDMLCSMGYEMSELEVCSDSELADICKNTKMNMVSDSNESKGEKWIQKSIKRPGALRKSMKKGEGEKITKSEIQKELAKLHSKDKDKSKKGVQGLGGSDLRKFRQLNLAKTLKGLKEHQENENYMFFANIENICRMCKEILAMDKNSVDEILSNGHGWATDHIATSKDDVEEVFNFLKTHSHDSEELIGGPGASYPRPKMDNMDSNFIQTYKDYKGFPDEK